VVAQQLIRDITTGKHHAVASSIVYGEVLGVSTSHQPELDLESFFSHIECLSTVSADDTICTKAGEICHSHGNRLKLPDSIHLATAIQAKADVFVTNDPSLVAAAKRVMTTLSLQDWQA
jgi:predicted nucleic acid-binding protein